MTGGNVLTFGTSFTLVATGAKTAGNPRTKNRYSV